MLLRLYLHRKQDDAESEQLRTVLNTVMRESQILRSNTSITPLDSLVFSLQDSGDREASSRAFEFLDNCILCLVRKPVHYYEILVNLIAASELDINPVICQIDLLLITVMDQWHYFLDRADAPEVTKVSKWLVRLIQMIDERNASNTELPLKEETTRLLSQIRDQLKSAVQDTTCRAMFEKALEERPELETRKTLIAANKISEAKYMSEHTGAPWVPHSNFPRESLPPGPPEEHEGHPGLNHWTRHEVQDAISEGHIKALIICLCSEHVDIRKQALTGIRTFMMKLEVSWSTNPYNRR